MNFPTNSYPIISMPSLDLPYNYEVFFETANSFKPYPYQCQFHQRDRNRAIHILIAPTGLGKMECFLLDWLWVFTTTAQIRHRGWLFVYPCGH